METNSKKEESLLILPLQDDPRLHRPGPSPWSRGPHPPVPSTLCVHQAGGTPLPPLPVHRKPFCMHCVVDSPF